MSLVGPRPLLVRYLPYFTDRERLRFSMRPGIAGLAQVMGRRNLDWETRLGYDVEYVENWSLFLDLSLCFKAVLIVLRGRGVEPASDCTIRDLDVERKEAQEERQEQEQGNAGETPSESETNADESLPHTEEQTQRA